MESVFSSFIFVHLPTLNLLLVQIDVHINLSHMAFVSKIIRAWNTGAITASSSNIFSASCSAFQRAFSSLPNSVLIFLINASYSDSHIQYCSHCFQKGILLSMSLDLDNLVANVIMTFHILSSSLALAFAYVVVILHLPLSLVSFSLAVL